METRVTPKLVDAARDGDESAWATIFDEHYPKLYRFFRARVASAEQAEDLTSNVFMEAFRSIEKFSWQGKPFVAWLFGIARHELASYYRALPPSESIVEPIVRDEYLEVEVRDILERLRPEYREALELRFVIGLSGMEAAAAMDRTHGAFRSLLLRAVRAFRTESAHGRQASPVPVRRLVPDTARSTAGRFSEDSR